LRGRFERRAWSAELVNADPARRSPLDWIGLDWIGSERTTLQDRLEDQLWEETNYPRGVVVLAVVAMTVREYKRFITEAFCYVSWRVDIHGSFAVYEGATFLFPKLLDGRYIDGQSPVAPLSFSRPSPHVRGAWDDSGTFVSLSPHQSIDRLPPSRPLIQPTSRGSK
jgi:hypothetical protein